MLRRVADRFGLNPKRLAADTACGSGRTLGSLTDRLRALAHTKVFERSGDERKKVEMAFAHLKRILKLDRLRLRGLSGARDEIVLAAAAQNLRKLVRYAGPAPPYRALGCAA